MTAPLLTIEIRQEPDVVLARQRARQVAALLGFDAQDQARVATAVSEVVRNAYQYAGGARVDFLVEDRAPPTVLVRVVDRGPAVGATPAPAEARPPGSAGEGPGLAAARRLMDRFEVEATPGAGTAVLLGKTLPRHAPALGPEALARVVEELARRGPRSPFEEVRAQNQELLHALEELARREAQLTQLNRELEETNRGVLALYAELDEKAEHLRRASEMKSRFLSDMSHEFRTPLNSVRSLANILLARTDGELTAEQAKQVGFMRKAAEDLTDLVNDLLDIAKVEAGMASVRPQGFEAGALFGVLRGMLRPLLAPDDAVALVFEEPSGLAALWTDEGKVAQVLRNFISNALKFTERGEVRVRAAAGPGDTVVFSVTDTGIGIRPEDWGTIFQEFTQIEGPRQRRVKGTGLGLPLSRKLAELLGGSVAVHSAPGAGSTFSLTLPRVYGRAAAGETRPAPEAEPAPAPAAGPAGPAPRGRVLLVDDDEVSRYLLRDLLADTDLEVIEAASGAEGLRLARAERPLAVFLDLDLPDMSGLDVLRQLRADDRHRHTPVIVRTSRVLDEADRRRLEASAAAVLSKEAASREAAAAQVRGALARVGLPAAPGEGRRG